MPLLRDGRISQDTWIALDDDAGLPGEGDVIVSYERLQKDAGQLTARKGRTGVAIENSVDMGELAAHLAHLDLIALDFPAFTDGRAYSQARRLRSEFGFTGELRATGDVLADQAGFLTQVGFDSFEVKNGLSLDIWNKAARSMTLAYQRGYDGDRKTRDAAL
ncbi:MAG: DUF934 domain-containing protein [Proteobacteria bacterium]|nr:DUF934 domain-containing protein [Pseudomonadota bacterium]